MWNSGTDSEPSKTPQDPCPSGWRIPSGSELEELIKNGSSWTEHEGFSGFWFSGTTPYAESEPRVFLPASGIITVEGESINRGYVCYYWSSRATRMNWNGYWIESAESISMSSSSPNILSSEGRGYGLAVRCVQE